jgi:carboxyl-terminal processing protease
MPPTRQQHLYFWLITIVLALACFTGGWWLGHNSYPGIEQVTELSNKETNKPEEVDFTTFWQAWNLINSKYIPTNGTSTESASFKKTTNQEKVWGAIGGLVASLGDPYSTFFPPEENKLFAEEISGNFGGIGLEVGVRDGILTAISPLSGTPAKRAGLLPGDKIIEINGKVAAQMSIGEAVSLIRGEIGTKVQLKVLRGTDDKPLTFSITRAKIEVPTIESKSLGQGIYLIRLYNFGATASRLFEQALKQFAVSGDTKLIIDLRGNAGGFLDAAVDTASWFLPANTPIVLEKRQDNVAAEPYASRGYKLFNKLPKMAVLVDGGTASAAEILAGALSEYDLATLVGEKTFGKGSVQELIPLPAGSALKLTVARWLTPKGHSLSKNGLEPNVAVKPPKNPPTNDKEDTQLQRAIELLAK